jgi:hypothetical protein
MNLVSPVRFRDPAVLLAARNISSLPRFFQVHIACISIVTVRHNWVLGAVAELRKATLKRSTLTFSVQ